MIVALVGKTMIDFKTCEDVVDRLNNCLKPIAKYPVDLDDPDWEIKLDRCSPLDEAGIRNEAENLLVQTIELYAMTDGYTRECLRQLFSKYDAFAWATGLPFEPDTDDQFRKHLLHFSLLDQGKDSRDAILRLQGLCEKAKMSGIKVKPILKEIAAISSDKDKYGMGSTKRLLLQAR
jgi:hypothetical protein